MSARLRRNRLFAAVSFTRERPPRMDVAWSCAAASCGNTSCSPFNTNTASSVFFQHHGTPRAGGPARPPKRRAAGPCAVAALSRNGYGNDDDGDDDGDNYDNDDDAHEDADDEDGDDDADDDDSDTDDV